MPHRFDILLIDCHIVPFLLRSRYSGHSPWLSFEWKVAVFTGPISSPSSRSHVAVSRSRWWSPHSLPRFSLFHREPVIAICGRGVHCQESPFFVASSSSRYSLSQFFTLSSCIVFDRSIWSI
ncbi:hypothetical protein ACOSP7_028472 [Xanthoceras sorbifolium]